MPVKKFPERNLQTAAKLNKRIRLQKAGPAEKALKSATKKMDFLQSINPELVVDFLGIIRGMVRHGIGRRGDSPEAAKERIMNNIIAGNASMIRDRNNLLQDHGKKPFTRQELKQIIGVYMEK